MKKISYAVLAVCALVLVGGCNVKDKKKVDPKPIPLKAVVVNPTGTIGGNSYHKAIEITFNGSSNYTWGAASTAPSIRAIEMSYATGLTNVNTFTLSYTRAGISRELLTVSGSMHTMTWYVPSTFYPMEGDVWRWSNSAAGAAVITIYVDYMY